MNNTEKVVLVTALFIIAVAVFSAISAWSSTVDVTSLPTWSQGFVQGVVNFFAATPIIILVGYFRNILGFLRNWVTKAKDEAVTYDLTRFRNTIATYFAFITPFVAAIPAPYNIIGYPVAIIVDLVVSEFNKILNPPELAPTLAPT